MLYLPLLLISIFTYASDLTGKIEVSVQKSQPDEFKFLFWDNLDNTIGHGKSPVITSEDLISAIKEEFTLPNEALSQIEKLKGKDGNTFFEFQYDEKGKLIYQCGTKDENDDVYIYGSQASFGLEPRIDFSRSTLFEQRVDIGKFYQLKWASKAQIKRHMAQCFSELPGMPKLKSRNPIEPTNLQLDPSLYNDFYKWFSKIDGIKIEKNDDPKFKSTVNCLLSNATQYFKNRTGNTIVIQKEVANENLIQSTILSEQWNLPPHILKAIPNEKPNYVYSISVMDEFSWKNLKKDFKKDKIQNMGIWPNLQSRSVLGLMGQIYGSDLDTYLQSCLLSSGLSISDPNRLLATFFQSGNCHDLNSNEHRIELECEIGKTKSCLLLANAYSSENHPKCMPEDKSPECFLNNISYDQNKGLSYFKKACSLGDAEGCFGAGHSLEGNLFAKDERIQLYQQGCKIKTHENCSFWNKGVDFINGINFFLKKWQCEGFLSSEDACYGVGLYFDKMGDKDRSIKFLKKSCEMVEKKNDYKACLELKNIETKTD
jgi:hypothetical protein